MKTIPLTRGYVTWIDDADYEMAQSYSWFTLNKCGRLYAATTVAGKRVYLHRLIMGALPAQFVDHKDGTVIPGLAVLDNRRNNLRFATKRQNAQGHQQKRRGTSSRYRGVCWDRTKDRWLSSIRVNGRSHFIGRFASEQTAAHAYDAAATEYFGAFVHLNFPSFQSL